MALCAGESGDDVAHELALVIGREERDALVSFLVG